MRVGLSSIEAVVSDGENRHRIADFIAVPCPHLEIVIRVEAQIPVGPQVGASHPRDPEETSVPNLRVERGAQETPRRGLRRRYERQPVAVVVVLVAHTGLIEAAALAVTTDPRRADLA